MTIGPPNVAFSPISTLFTELLDKSGLSPYLRTVTQKELHFPYIPCSWATVTMVLRYLPFPGLYDDRSVAFLEVLVSQ